VIIVPLIQIHLAAPEDADKFFQGITTRRRLCNHKLGLYLPAKLRFVIPEDGDTKTAFPINETSYPSVDPESFLLIVRTSHIVTAFHTATIQNSCIRPGRRVVEDATEFPANSRLLTYCHQYEGQHPFACKGASLSAVTTDQSNSIEQRTGRFRRSPYVAIGLGPYLQLTMILTSWSAYGL